MSTRWRMRVVRAALSSGREGSNLGLFEISVFIFDARASERGSGVPRRVKARDARCRRERE